MKEITIYHNPKCSTSRTILKSLHENDYKVIIVEYLKTPLTKSKIKTILELSGLKASQLLRKKEPLAKELNLFDSGISENQLIEAMAANPILIERPILSNGKIAVIARPMADYIEKIETKNLF